MHIQGLSFFQKLLSFEFSLASFPDQVNPIYHLGNFQINPYLIIGWEREVLRPGGIWGRVQGVGPDHWGTRSQP